MSEPMRGVCRLCGRDTVGQWFPAWVTESFTNWDMLVPGDIVCADCAPWFEQRSQALADKLGRDKATAESK